MQGCSKEAIGQMSKHMTAKIDTAYLPELPAEAMHAGAGFSIQPPEAYFVPRAFLRLPWSDEIITISVFPEIRRWRNEIKSINGDSGRAAHNFIHKLLPYLAKVVVQDGVFWIEKLPNHQISLQLCRSFE